MRIQGQTILICMRPIKQKQKQVPVFYNSESAVTIDSGYSHILPIKHKWLPHIQSCGEIYVFEPTPYHDPIDGTLASVPHAVVRPGQALLYANLGETLV